MAETDLCKEKYIDGKLVSRICIRGDLFFLKDQFRPPTYELSVVSSCASCPPYPPATSGLDEDKIKYIVKEIVSDHLQQYHHHPHESHDH